MKTKTLIIISFLLLICNCAKIQKDGNTYTAFLTNVKDGSVDINSDRANDTVKSVAITALWANAIKSIANTAGGVMKNSNNNEVLKADGTNNLTKSLDGNATQLELERIKSAKEIKLLELTPQTQP